MISIGQEYRSLNLEILTCDPLICTINHPRFNVLNQMEEFISIQSVITYNPFNSVHCARSVFPIAMNGALSVTPVRLSVHLYLHHTQQCPLSKSNSFDQNFMKLGHIVWYYNVSFKLDNGPYHNML